MKKKLKCAFLLILFSCTTDRKTDKEENSLKSISYYTFGNITSLDPTHSATSDHYNFCGLVYNGLVQTNKNMDVVPCIAKRFEYNMKEFKYVFYLRNDVYFHDDSCFLDGKGRKVKADDVIYSFNRSYRECYEQFKYLFHYFNLDTVRKEIKGLKALNDSTLEIQLPGPCVYFLKMLTMKIFSIIPHEAVEFYTDKFKFHAVGTGPFCLINWDRKEKILLRKNQRYFEKDADGNSLPYIDRIIFMHSCDRRTTNMEVLNNKVDILAEHSENNLELFGKDGNLNKKYADIMNVYPNKVLKIFYLGFVVNPKMEGAKNSPALNKNIRKAIHFSLDRKKLSLALTNHAGIPVSNGFFPDFLYPALKYNKIDYYNPDSAKYYLAKAGYPEGKGMPELFLHYPERNSSHVLVFQSELSKHGINIQVKKEPNENYQSKIKLGILPGFLRSWTYDFNDDVSLFGLFYSKYIPPLGFNYSGYKNERFDRLYESVSSDTVNRFNTFLEMNRILMDDLPVIPLYFKESFTLVNKKVRHFEMNALDLINFKIIKKESPL